MEYILETYNLEKKYKNFKAINNLNMHIEKGSIYGLIGKNGAGKTTLIRVICGLQKPTNGYYSIYGTKNTDSNILKIRKRMGAIIETPSIYLNLSAKDNLIEQYKVLGMPSYDGIDELLKIVGLENTGTKRAKDFSLGMKQRLGIAISLVSNPDFLILDEPINGLDPQGIIEMRELIIALNQKKNITILISSHYLDELSKIATNYGFIERGTIIKEISSNQLTNQLQKKIEIKVNNINECVRYLESNSISYEIIDNQNINIYGNVNISKIIIELSRMNCILENLHEVDESLENYYMNLIGGDGNE